VNLVDCRKDILGKFWRSSIKGGKILFQLFHRRRCDNDRSYVRNECSRTNKGNGQRGRGHARLLGYFRILIDADAVAGDQRLMYSGYLTNREDDDVDDDGGDPSRYLPLKRPPARTDQGSNPIW
jgi:hypothetical protein